MKINIESNDGNIINKNADSIVQDKILRTVTKHRGNLSNVDEMSIVVNYLKYDEEDLNTEIFSDNANIVCPPIS